VTAKVDFISERDVHNPVVLVEVTGRPGTPYVCELLGIGNGEAHLRSESWIAESSRVILTFDSLAIPGEVLYSNKKGDTYRTAVSLGSEHERKRKEPRFPINQPGRIAILNASGTTSSECMLTDVSASGLGLTAVGPAEAGCMVYVTGDFGLLVGEVRYCRRGADGRYRMGVETTGVYAGTESPRRSVPLLQRTRLKIAEIIAGKRLRRNAG